MQNHFRKNIGCKSNLIVDPVNLLVPYPDVEIKACKFLRLTNLDF